MESDKYIKVYFPPNQEYGITDLMGFAAGRSLRISGVIEETADGMRTTGDPALDLGDTPPVAADNTIQ
jgi:hypothetical protein